MIDNMGIEKMRSDFRGTWRREPLVGSEEHPVDGGERDKLDRDQNQDIAPYGRRENGHGIVPVWRRAASAKDLEMGRPGEIHAAGPFWPGSLALGAPPTNATIPPGRP